jgi:hypothetical protein
MDSYVGAEVYSIASLIEQPNFRWINLKFKGQLAAEILVKAEYQERSIEAQEITPSAAAPRKSLLTSKPQIHQAQTK